MIITHGRWVMNHRAKNNLQFVYHKSSGEDSPMEFSEKVAVGGFDRFDQFDQAPAFCTMEGSPSYEETWLNQ